MKLRMLASSLLLVFATGPTAGSAATEPATVDWIVATVIAGPEGAQDVEVRLLGDGETANRQPDALGIGAGSAWGWTADVLAGREGRTTIRTTDQLGSIDLEVLPPAAPHGGKLGLIAGMGDIAPSDWRRLLMFSTDTPFVPDVSWSVTSGSISVRLHTGVGSRAFTLSDADGLGANVGYSSAGDVTLTHTTEMGIVGAFEFGCEICSGSWTSPDGETRTHSGTTAIGSGYGGRGYHGFAGPAGTWTWKWTGLRPRLWSIPVLGEHTLLAYAPIGTDLALPPPEGLPGPRQCAGSEATGPQRCSFVFSGDHLWVYAQQNAAAPSTIRAIAPDGRLLATCTTDGPLLATCDTFAGDTGLPPGAIIRCEVDGVTTANYACIGVSDATPSS